MPLTEGPAGFLRLGMGSWLLAARDLDTPKPVDETTMRVAFAARLSPESDPQAQPEPDPDEPGED